MAESVVFVLAGATALGSALAMVLMRNAVHSALMLVVNFFAIAVLYAALEAQFLFVVQLIVYAGAIMVLFLFVLMLLGIGPTEVFTERIRGQKTAAVLLGLALFAALAGVAAPYMTSASACGTAAAQQAALQGDPVACQGLAQANAQGNVRGIGLRLFTQYVWPFEVMSVLLVIAALGALVIGRRSEAAEDLVDRVTAAEPGGSGGLPPARPGGSGGLPPARVEVRR